MGNISVEFTLFEEFIELFTGMGIIAGALLVLGLVFCVIEMFQPSNGYFAGAGILFLIAGTAVRLIPDFSLSKLFILVFLIVTLMFIFHLISIRLTKYGWLKRTSNLNKVAVSGEKSHGFKDYYFLLNLEGVAVTDIRPRGKIEINEIEFDVSALDEPIERGHSVKVVEVEGDRITVKAI